MMKTDRLKENLIRLLAPAGIEINGSDPWDIRVLDDSFYTSLFADGTLGAGESYMEGWWECDQLDEMISRVLVNRIETKIRSNLNLLTSIFLSRIGNRQSKHRAIANGQRHYDIGNDLFSLMLGKRMAYTCGYWKNARTLDEAQENKLELTCRKLNLKPGMHVLDIGCGWGSFARYAAEKYDVRVTGITVSKEQVELGTSMCAGLPVELKLMDYRDLDGNYDSIVSMGMFEHVGHKNYRTFMQKVCNCLKDDGLFLLHTIGSNDSGTHTDPWLDKYIFPGSLIPSAAQIAKAYDGLLVMEDWHNFGADYDKTLMAWYHHFEKGREALRQHYDHSFYRMWKYYLLTCAGSFRARKNQLWQIVFSKKGLPGGYMSIR